MSLSFKMKRSLVRERDGNNCWICNEIVIEGLRDGHPRMATLDHVIEVCNGGSNRLDNLRLAHSKCNNDRSNRKGLIRKRDFELHEGNCQVTNKSDLINYIQRINKKMSELFQ